MVVYRSLGSLADDRVRAVLYRPLATALLRCQRCFTRPPTTKAGSPLVGIARREEKSSAVKRAMYIYFPLSANFTCFGKWALKAELFCVGTG